MDDKTALDLLSSDFETTPAPVPSSAAATKLEPPKLDSQPLKVGAQKQTSRAASWTGFQWNVSGLRHESKLLLALTIVIFMILSQPMAGPVLDTLADTLIPDAMEAKSQTDKPKVTGLNLVSSVVNYNWI